MVLWRIMGVDFGVPTHIWATDMTVLSFERVIRQVLVRRHFRNISSARAGRHSSGCHSLTTSHFSSICVLQDHNRKQIVSPAGMFLLNVLSLLFINWCLFSWWSSHTGYNLECLAWRRSWRKLDGERMAPKTQGWKFKNLCRAPIRLEL